MKIEIQPHSLKNLKNICTVLYQLHPTVLNYLVDMGRTLDGVMGMINLNQPTMEQREFLTSGQIDNTVTFEPKMIGKKISSSLEELCNSSGDFLNSFEKFLVCDDDYNEDDFYEYKKLLRLNTDEYIPIKINIEIDDPVIGRKLRELVRILEKTGAPEQYYWGKEELDIEAYFAEGYGLTMNEEQRKRVNDFYDKMDTKELMKILIKEKIHPFK